MKLHLVATACALFALASSISACASLDALTGGGSGKSARDAIIGDLQTCKRHYTGSFSTTSITGSADIQCDPVVAKPAASTSPPSP